MPKTHCPIPRWQRSAFSLDYPMKKSRREALLILLFLLGLMGLLATRYGRFQSTHLAPLYGEDFARP